jgi:hypothetical protein
VEQLQIAVHNALASWNQIGGTDEELLGYLLLVQRERSVLGDGDSPLALRQATNAVLQSGMEELTQQDARGVRILQNRFVDGEITRHVAVKMQASTDQVNRWQRSAVESLTQIIAGREQDLIEERRQHFAAELPPPPYTRLFGFEQARSTIVERLLVQDEPWAVVISGLGGIGKTSLADAAVRQTMQQLVFERVIWTRFDGRSLGGQSLSPDEGYERLLDSLVEQLWPGDSGGETRLDQTKRVRQVLTERPHLIAIDNLETEAHTAYVLEQIQELVGPTKFLLTTRARLTPFWPAFVLPLEEIPLEDATDLLRHHAETAGIVQLAQAGETDMGAVYQVTGGNPLALKLVASLASILPLHQILADLGTSRPGPIEELYRHIYWRAWRTLGKEAQALLQAMPLAAEAGALPEQMQAFSGLSETAFWPAVTELISRSLLEVRGTLHERRYGIHRLTETFIRTEIVHWPET